jgi:DNA-binding response OmpR family regulator
MAQRVLVVEDEADIAFPLVRTLEREGYDVAWVENGEDALASLAKDPAEVVILDLGLPDVDGLEVCRRAREAGFLGAIMIVTARAGELDRVVGLDYGADDYLAKPFGMRELVARVQALLRRTRSGADGSESLEPIDAPGLLIDAAGRRAFLLGDAGERIDAELTPTEFRLLLTLARQPGRVLDRDELQQRVWNVPYRARDRSVDVCVRKLREKLDRRSTHSYIQTQYGVGYRFDPTPQVEEAV